MTEGKVNRKKIEGSTWRERKLCWKWKKTYVFNNLREIVEDNASIEYKQDIVKMKQSE